MLRKALRRLKLWSGPHPINNGSEQLHTKRRIAQPHFVEEWVGRVYTTLCIVLLVVTIVAIVYFVSSEASARSSSMASARRAAHRIEMGSGRRCEAFWRITVYIRILQHLFVGCNHCCAAWCLRSLVHDADYAGSRPSQCLQPVIELLAGIPSVVFGFVGLSIVVPLLRDIFPGQGIGIAAGAIVFRL